MKKRLAALTWSLACVVLLDSRVTAQDLSAEARQIMDRADVKRAFDYVDGHKDQILAEWIALTEINAPSGKERDRAEAVRLARMMGADVSGPSPHDGAAGPSPASMAGSGWELHMVRSCV